MSEQNSISSGSLSVVGNLLKVLKFILVSYVVSALLIAGLAALLAYTSLPEALANPGVRIIRMFGAFLTGLMLSRSVGKRGLLWGFAGGMMNIVLLGVLGSFLPEVSQNISKMLLTSLAGGATGALGGIIGINTNKN